MHRTIGDVEYDDLPRTYWHLFVEESEGQRINTARVALRRLVYSTWASYRGLLRAGEIVLTSRPFYEITEIPAGSKVALERIDPNEDGTVWFVGEEVEWEDGLKEEDILFCSMKSLYNYLATKKRRALLGEIKAASVSELAEVVRPKRKLREEDGKIVKDPFYDDGE